MTDDLGPADLRPLVLDIIARMPDARNPTEGDYPSICLYTDPDDPSRHCIVGQLATEMAWDLPDCTVCASGLVDLADWPVTEAGGFWLDRLQAEADGNEPVPWGQIEVPPA